MDGRVTLENGYGLREQTSRMYCIRGGRTVRGSLGHAVNHPFMTMRGPRIKWKYKVEWMKIDVGKHSIKIRNESVNDSKACSCWKCRV